MPRKPLHPAWAKTFAEQGRVVALARRKAGLSQPQASEALGIPLWSLRGYEQGKRGMPDRLKVKLIKAWRIPRKALGIDTDACPCCGRPF